MLQSLQMDGIYCLRGLTQFSFPDPQTWPLQCPALPGLGEGAPSWGARPAKSGQFLPLSTVPLFLTGPPVPWSRLTASFPPGGKLRHGKVGIGF